MDFSRTDSRKLWWHVLLSYLIALQRHILEPCEQVDGPMCRFLELQGFSKAQGSTLTSGDSTVLSWRRLDFIQQLNLMKLKLQ